jgi:hypothetical protein
VAQLLAHHLRVDVAALPCAPAYGRSWIAPRASTPNEVPSVVAVPIIDGGPDYIDWILEQTEQPA